ncbi:MAG TPA: enoyl-CoA hydratase-related protein [Povalibacter sp.]|uniref:enoyl-CoA hydratase/isomerase family protein n=1 Tax=Povalibacter sp. TaxID=1962978 RepID=UPI002CB2EDAF|nr:enoyl-CoA hydratase-related protein [Povalibacter sp.]HMN43673.1 enoyl-CoA hydratase-related protein [Povalibacter sp.]
MSTNPSLLFEREGAVATLRLNRPDVGNALDIPLARSLMEAAIQCDEDDAIRCVVLTGNGRMFCAGGDVGAFAAAGDSLPAMLKEITAYLHAAITRLSRMGKPLVTAVNGPAAGAGYSLAVLGDIALAARSAHFTLAYTALGLTPDGGSTWLLPRLVGLRRAQELALLNKRLSAEEAATLGLVTRAVDDAGLGAEAGQIAQQLAASATPALGKVRNLLLTSFSSTLEAQMEAEARSIADSSRTRYGREGVAAFVTRRKPDFT